MNKLTDFLKKVGGYRVAKGLSHLQLEELIPKVRSRLGMRKVPKNRWAKLTKETLMPMGYDSSEIDIVAKALELMKSGTERETAYQIAVKLLKGGKK